MSAEELSPSRSGDRIPHAVEEEQENALKRVKNDENDVECELDVVVVGCLDDGEKT